MKTRTVSFTYGTAKDAKLEVPAEAFSINDAATLIRQSYLKWMFDRPALMSDECVLSSIGRSNFFAGALGGWETRLDAKAFAAVKSLAEDDMILALEIVKFRQPGIARDEACRKAAQNEALSEAHRDTLRRMADAFAEMAKV